LKCNEQSQFKKIENYEKEIKEKNELIESLNLKYMEKEKGSEHDPLDLNKILIVKNDVIKNYSSNIEQLKLRNEELFKKVQE